jgi:hypothetical protein
MGSSHALHDFSRTNLDGKLYGAMNDWLFQTGVDIAQLPSASWNDLKLNEVVKAPSLAMDEKNSNF